MGTRRVQGTILWVARDGGRTPLPLCATCCRPGCCQCKSPAQRESHPCLGAPPALQVRKLASSQPRPSACFKGGTWRSESMDTGTSLLCWLPPPQHVWPCKWISPTLSHTGKEGRTTRECGWRSARIAAPRRQWNTLWPVHSHIEAAQHQKSMSSILLGAHPVCVCVH